VIQLDLVPGKWTERKAGRIGAVNVLEVSAVRGYAVLDGAVSCTRRKQRVVKPTLSSRALPGRPQSTAEPGRRVKLRNDRPASTRARGHAQLQATFGATALDRYPTRLK
jgi:hypothetical protein